MSMSWKLRAGLEPKKQQEAERPKYQTSLITSFHFMQTTKWENLTFFLLSDKIN